MEKDENHRENGGNNSKISTILWFIDVLSTKMHKNHRENEIIS